MPEIDVPILRNDEETLEERMSDNAYNKILPGRYLTKNEKGEIVEEQEEFFERIAENIALAELAFADESLWGGSKPRVAPHLFRKDYDEAQEITEENVKHLKKVPKFIRDDERYEDVYEKYEETKEEFLETMEKLGFMPNTPTLINAGNEMQQLSACFVNSPDDDMEDIGDTETEASLIFQSGGGVGYDFGKLRPYGDPVGSTGGIASGPITFMQRYDQNCETVAQGGVRRGAQMGTMQVTHPDIIHFIHAKNRDVSLAHQLRLNDPDDPTYTDFGKAIEEARELITEDGKVPEHLRNAVEGHLSNFNISVTITDEFMHAVKNDKEYTLINPRTDEPHIASEETKEMYSWFDLEHHVEVGEELTLPANEIWERIVEGAWSNGEPGVMYIDAVNHQHSFDTDIHPEYEMTTSNPCAEQNLMEYEACNLGHINLSTIVDKNVTPATNFKGGTISEDETIERWVSDFLDQAIDWEEFNHRIRVGTRFLDNVVTMSDFPIDEIEETVRKNRKIGLGIMGLAQLFIQLGVEYGSEVGNEVARQIMRHINHASKGESHDLALERGAFENYPDSKYADPLNYPEWFREHVGLAPEGWEMGYEVRNHNTTTIAPTGTTSRIADTTGGCEPIYNVAFFKNVTDDIQGDEMLVVFDSLFIKTLEENGIDPEEVKDYAEDLMMNNEFDGVDDLAPEMIPQEIADLFVTTEDLDSKEHAGVLCAMQEGVDSSISKTLNAPEDATIEDAKETFEYVFDNGGKSVTFYRQGSRTKQVNTTENIQEEEDGESEEDCGCEDGSCGIDIEDEEEESSRREAPKEAVGVRYEIKTGYGELLVSVSEDDEGIVEVIANLGKAGGTMQSATEGIGRMVSNALQEGMDVEDVIDQLEDIKSPHVGFDQGDTVHSIPDAIALALKRHKEKDIQNMMNHTTVVPENHEEDSEEDEKEVEGETSGEPCPEPGCDEQLIYIEGCKECPDPTCGYSHC